MTPTELLFELQALASLEGPRAPWPEVPPAGTTVAELDDLEQEVLAYLRRRDEARRGHGERCRRAVNAFLHARCGIPYDWPDAWGVDWAITLGWCFVGPEVADADYWITRWRHDAECSLGFASGSIHEWRRREHGEVG